MRSENHKIGKTIGQPDQRDALHTSMGEQLRKGNSGNMGNPNTIYVNTNSENGTLITAIELVRKRYSGNMANPNNT